MRLTQRSTANFQVPASDRPTDPVGCRPASLRVTGTHTSILADSLPYSVSYSWAANGPYSGGENEIMIGGGLPPATMKILGTSHLSSD